MEVPGISRPVLIGLIVVAAALFAFGAAEAADVLTQHTDTRTRTLAAAPTMVISAGIGDVKVVAADRTDVRLTIKEKRSVWGGGHVDVGGDAAGLRLRDRCEGMPLADGTCGVSYRLEVPRDTNVRVVSGTGDVRAEDLHGSADLQSGTGDLHVIDVSGTLRLHATGDVHVEAPAPDIAVQTGTGDIDVVATHPLSIQAQSGTGDIVFSVPDETYAVDARAEVGRETVTVREGDASPRRLRAHTDTGDVVMSAGV